MQFELNAKEKKLVEKLKKEGYDIYSSGLMISKDGEIDRYIWMDDEDNCKYLLIVNCVVMIRGN